MPKTRKVEENDEVVSADNGSTRKKERSKKQVQMKDVVYDEHEDIQNVQEQYGESSGSESNYEEGVFEEVGRVDDEEEDDYEEDDGEEDDGQEDDESMDEMGDDSQMFDESDIDIQEMMSVLFENEDGENIPTILSDVKVAIDNNSKCLLKIHKEIAKLVAIQSQKPRRQ